MSQTSQFDVGTAALEHLELLNHSNQSPLEIAAQFRTLLRSNKTNRNDYSNDIDYSYMDYITTNATIRRRGRSRSLGDRQLKSFGRIQYDFIDNPCLSDLNSSYMSAKCQDENSSIEDIYPDSAVGSDSSEPTVNSFEKPKQIKKFNSFQYPIINWKQLREKQYESRLDKVKKFIQTKFTVQNHVDSNKNDIKEDISIRNSSQSRSSSTSIRTPSISPINSPRSTYTISRLNSTDENYQNEDILFPIADCNLIIKHKPIQRTKSVVHRSNSNCENERLCLQLEKTVYL